MDEEVISTAPILRVHQGWLLGVEERVTVAQATIALLFIYIEQSSSHIVCEKGLLSLNSSYLDCKIDVYHYVR